MRVARLQFRKLSTHFYLLAASAFLLLLAFPHPGWGWLAHVALVPLIILATRSRNTRTVVWTSWLVFFVWWLLRSRWMIPVTGGGYVAMCAIMSVYVPLALVLIRWLDRKYLLPLTFVTPMAWCSAELLREHLFAGGFNWYMLSHTQAAYTPRDGFFGGLAQLTAGRFVQVADIFGERGVTFLLCMTNGLIADVLLKSWTLRGAAGRRVPNRALRLALVAWSVAILGAWFYGGWRLAQTDALEASPQARRFHVMVVQSNIPQSNRDSPSLQVMASDLVKLLRQTEQAVAAHRDVGGQPLDLVVLPETAFLFPLNPEAREYLLRNGLDDFAELDRILTLLVRERLGVPLLTGARTEYDFTEIAVGRGTMWVSERPHNSAYLYTQTDGQTRRYDKLHLVPFGEYIPWVGGWPWLKDRFIDWFTPYTYDYTVKPGKAETMFELPGNAAGDAMVRFVVPICYEAASARLTRRLVREDGKKVADVILNITNDGWYDGTAQQPQHLQISTLRCIENRVPMARSVNTGISAMVDSAGRIRARVEVDGRVTGVAGAVAMPLVLDDRGTLFGQWGQLPMWLLCVATLVLAVLGLARRDAPERL